MPCLQSRSQKHITMFGPKSQRIISAILATYFFFLLAHHFGLAKDKLLLKDSLGFLRSNSSDVLSSQHPGSLSAAKEVHNIVPPRFYAPLPSNMPENGPKVRQCTIILPGANLPHYERALRTHVRHGERWGYPTHVLRNFLVANEFYNKPAYTIYLILEELGKPASERAEWIFWFDADSVLLNPCIPLGTFLPPDDFSQYHFLAAKDWNGLNAGVFFIRVHQWSVDFITEVMAEPLLKPNVEHVFLEQGDMARVLEKSKYRDNVIYQPRMWYNTYSKGNVDAEDPEVILGNMQVHFPGVANKQESMGYWLDKVEKTKDWSKPINETNYLGHVEEFWELLRTFRLTIARLAEAANAAPKDAELSSIFEVAHDDLQKLVREEPFETEKLLNALSRSLETLEAPKWRPATKPANQLPSPSPLITNCSHLQSC